MQLPGIWTGSWLLCAGDVKHICLVVTHEITLHSISIDLPTPKYFCQYFQQPMSLFSDFWTDFLLMHRQPIQKKKQTNKQTKKCRKVKFSIIHLVRRVCGLTSLITYTDALHSDFVHICEIHSQLKTAQHFLQKQCTMYVAFVDADASFLETYERLSFDQVCFLGFMHSSASSSVSYSHLSSTPSNSNQPYRKMVNFRKVSKQSGCSWV